MNTSPRSCLRLSLTPSLIPSPLLLPLLVVACLLLQVPSAAAQSRPQGAVIGLERAFGFGFSTVSDGDTDPTDQTVTSLALGGPSLGSGLTLPRLGVDYVLPNGISLGSGLGLTTVSSSVGDGLDTTVTILTLAPRAGYVAMLSPRVALWPRAGLSVLRTSTSIGFSGQEEDSRETELALSVEAPFVFLPIPQLGILLAPTFDRTLSTSTDDAPDSEAKTTAFGIHAGIVVDF